GLGHPSEPQPPPSPAQPTNEEPIPNVLSSSHQKTQTPRQDLNQVTELPQTSVPIPNVSDGAVYEEWDDKLERATTTAASLDVEQASGTINRTQSITIPNVPLPQGVGAGGSLRCQEAMGIILLRLESLEADLKQTKEVYGAAYTKLIMKVKKLEKTVKTSHSRRRAKIVILDDEEASKDSSKQKRMIEEIDQDAGVTLVTPIRGEDQPEDQLVVLSATKILADAAKINVYTYTRRRRAVSTGSGRISTASRLFSTAEESVSTTGASMPVSTAGMVQEVNISIPSPVVIKDKACVDIVWKLLVHQAQRNGEENYELALDELGASVSVMPYSTFTKLGLGKLDPPKLNIELADKTIKHPKGIAENVLVGINKFVFPVDFIVLDIPENIKIPLILGRPFLSTAHAKVDVFKRKFALRIGNDKIVFKSDRPTSNIIKKVYVLGLRERMELDLEARLMGAALILNRSQDPEFGDFLELNDLNEPLELRNHENEDLDPEIEEGEIIDEPMIDIVEIRYDNGIVEKIDEYPSFCDYDRKIHINCAYNLQFSCMIGYEHVNANFFPVLSINIMSKSFYNSIMKEKIDYKGKNFLGTFINVPIFVGNFLIVTYFTVMENMDAYRDKDMGDVIFGKPFCRNAGVEARRFDGFITIHNGNDNVTSNGPVLSKDSIRRIQYHGYGVSTLLLVPSCFVIFDLEPLSLSFDFVFSSEVVWDESMCACYVSILSEISEIGIKRHTGVFLRSLNLFLVCLDRLFHLAILYLDQHAHTLHHLESLLTISLDRLDILKEDLFEHEHVVMNPTQEAATPSFAQFRRTSLTGFPAQSVRSSNADALDLPYLLVLNTRTSQSRQHDTSESNSLMSRDINSLFGRVASLSRRLCGRETAHALVEKKGKAKDEYYGKLILDLGNEVRSSMEQGTAVMEKLVEKLGNAGDKVECKKLKKELEEARIMPPKFAPLTQAAIRRMNKESVDDAIVAERARHANTGNDARGSGPVRGQDVAPAIRECTFVGFMKCNPTAFHGPALTWWNAKIATMGLETVNQMPWTEMKQLMTVEFCPIEEVQPMEHELWNLKVKEYNIVAYTQRFNELALMCPRMVESKRVKVDAYMRGLTDNIKGEVTSSKPANLNEAMRMAYKLMEQKSQARDERILEGNKRKWRAFKVEIVVVRAIIEITHVKLCRITKSKGTRELWLPLLLMERCLLDHFLCVSVVLLATLVRVLSSVTSVERLGTMVTLGTVCTERLSKRGRWRCSVVDLCYLGCCADGYDVGCTLNLRELVFESGSLCRNEIGTFDVIISCWVGCQARMPLSSVAGMLFRFINASKYVERGCHLFLAYVTENKSKKKRMEDVPVIRDFPKVFPEELLAPSEMKELSVQLQELLEKGFIHPSSSLRGALVTRHIECIFLGGFLVEEFALEAMKRMIKKRIRAGYSQVFDVSRW
ncbi:putative reverse transcriptase domain-containing protein, partial [Tanacetum coccineum]